MQFINLNQEYNNFGIKVTQPFDLNPQSNSGLVYLPANEPASPGALSSGQAISDLTFVSGYSQRRIRITMNPADTPVQTAGSLAVIDENNNIIVSLADGSQTTAVYINPRTNTNALNVFGTTASTTVPLVTFNQLEATASGSVFQLLNYGSGNTINAESKNDGDGAVFQTDGHGHAFIGITKGGGTPFVANQELPTSVNFYRVFSSLTPLKNIYISDGTDPNGALIGNLGDLCLAVGAGAPSYCAVDGTDIWIQLL